MNLESDFFQVEQLEKQRSDDGKRYLEFIRVPAMSAGLYVLPGGGQDPQKPHNEDELYYVVRGRARVRALCRPAAGPRQSLTASSRGNELRHSAPSGVTWKLSDSS